MSEVDEPHDGQISSEFVRKLVPNWKKIPSVGSPAATQPGSGKVREREPLKLIISPVIDLKHVIPKASLAKKEEVDRVAKFFIKSNEQVEYLGVFLDQLIMRFYTFMLRRPLMVNPRVGDFNSDTEQMSSFAVFTYRGHLRFPNLAEVLKATQEVKTGDELIIQSNSYALSIEEIFANSIHKAIVASSAPKFGVFMTDARGFPEIEGSIVTKPVEVLVSDKPAATLYSVVGIIIPGVFYRNSFREYITIGASFKNLARSLLTYLATYHYLEAIEGNPAPVYGVDASQNKVLLSGNPNAKSLVSHPRILQLCSTFLKQFDLVSNTQLGGAHLPKDDLPQFHDGSDTLELSNPVVEFWLRRTVKISVADASGTSDTMGTGIAINKYLVLTNKHVAAESNSPMKVIHQGRSIPVQWVIPNQGCLDLAFLVMKFKLDIRDDVSFVGDKIGLSPIADKVPSPEMHPFLTSGGLMKTFTYKDIPTLLHFSGLIFAGNSGGCILNSKGQLIGVVYANLELIASQDDRNGQDSYSTHKMTMNEMAFGICLVSESHTLSQLLEFDSLKTVDSTKNALAGMLAQAQEMKLLDMRDTKLSDAQALYSAREELEKCLPNKD